jgi:lipopolysaccharide/colanic/teichoic acid biosynthesis glycosyltransferase
MANALRRMDDDLGLRHAPAGGAVRLPAHSPVRLPVPRWKRAFDLFFAMVLGLPALPLLLVAAAAIKVADGGPVLFWQRRVGRGGEEFWCPKLRSMREGAERLHKQMRQHNMHGDSITFKMKTDPRVTTVGRFLRTTSLDELPQFWCVLTGQMSIVGPRPPLPWEVEEYTPHQRRRLEVNPGITGLWQVSGRSTIAFDGQVALDIEYIERQSLWLDLAIVAKTIPAVLSRRGAW